MIAENPMGRCGRPPPDPLNGIVLATDLGAMTGATAAVVTTYSLIVSWHPGQ
jgi:hypothetical protein